MKTLLQHAQTILDGNKEIRSKLGGEDFDLEDFDLEAVLPLMVDVEMSVQHLNNTDDWGDEDAEAELRDLSARCIPDAQYIGSTLTKEHQVTFGVAVRAAMALRDS